MYHENIKEVTFTYPNIVNNLTWERKAYELQTKSSFTLHPLPSNSTQILSINYIAYLKNIFKIFKGKTSVQQVIPDEKCYLLLFSHKIKKYAKKMFSNSLKNTLYSKEFGHPLSTISYDILTCELLNSLSFKACLRNVAAVENITGCFCRNCWN